MRKFLLSMALSLVASTALAQSAPSAEVKVGTGVANHEIEGAAASFKVAPDTKLFTWVKVAGAADSKITVTFAKDGKEVNTIDLAVSRSPYRTQAYRTFRKGDAGNWTAVVKSAAGAELGKAEFTVELQ